MWRIKIKRLQSTHDWGGFVFMYSTKQKKNERFELTTSTQISSNLHCYFYANTPMYIVLTTFFLFLQCLYCDGIIGWYGSISQVNVSTTRAHFLPVAHFVEPTQLNSIQPVIHFFHVQVKHYLSEYFRHIATIHPHIFIGFYFQAKFQSTSIKLRPKNSINSIMLLTHCYYKYRTKENKLIFIHFKRVFFFVATFCSAAVIQQSYCRWFEAAQVRADRFVFHQIPDFHTFRYFFETNSENYK